MYSLSGKFHAMDPVPSPFRMCSSTGRTHFEPLAQEAYYACASPIQLSLTRCGGDVARRFGGRWRGALISGGGDESCGRSRQYSHQQVVPLFFILLLHLRIYVHQNPFFKTSSSERYYSTDLEAVRSSW